MLHILIFYQAIQLIFSWFAIVRRTISPSWASLCFGPDPLSAPSRSQGNFYIAFVRLLASPRCPLRVKPADSSHVNASSTCSPSRCSRSSPGSSGSTSSSPTSTSPSPCSFLSLLFPSCAGWRWLTRGRGDQRLLPHGARQPSKGLAMGLHDRLRRLWSQYVVSLPPSLCL